MKTTLVELALTLGWVLSTCENHSLAQTWTPTSAPITNWSCVASSADGSKLVAAVTNGFIYTSTNWGKIWTQSAAPSNSWTRLASSADGNQLFAAANIFGSGLIYRSTNSGATWEPSSSGQAFWDCVACSADGSKVAATHFGPSFSVSTDFGASWAILGPEVVPTFLTIGSVASSGDGGTLAVVLGVLRGPPSQLVTTPSSVWGQRNVPGPFFFGVCASIAMSADGTRVVAAINNTAEPAPMNCGGMLYSSSGSGATAVTNCTTVTNWTSVASSADGTRLVAVASGGAIYTSTDAGTNWVPASVTNANWTSVTSSADGARLVAVANGGGIYTWQTTPTPRLNITPIGNGLLVSWLIPSMNFQLQENFDLDTTNWTDVAILPTLNFTNLQDQLTLLPAVASRFYRLKHP
jgi:hypothetical protein